VAAVLARLGPAGAAARPLAVSHAFHSPLMDPMLDAFTADLAGVRLSAPRLAFVSTASGREAGAELADPAYWVDQIRAPVLFGPAQAALWRRGERLFLELGPRPVLTTLGPGCVPAAEREQGRWLAPLRPERDDEAALLEALAGLIAAGVGIDWPAFEAGRPGRKVRLPTYPFERRRHWLDRPGLDKSAPRPAASAGLDTLDPATLLARLEAEGGPLDAAERQALPGLLARLSRLAERATATGLLYQEVWRPQPAPAAPLAPAGSWLLVGRAAALDTALAEALRGAGQQVRQAETAAAAQAALADPGLSGVVHLAGPDATAALAETLALARGLTGSRARLWLVLTGLPAPVSGALTGLSRVLAAERPEQWGGLVDLPADAAEAAGWLAGELACPGPETVSYAADGTRRVARLVPAPAGGAPGWQADPAGIYLVTGGLGALGLAVADWLAGRGVGHLLLVGRRPPDAAAEARLAGLRARGMTVESAAVDVSDAAALDRLVAGLGGRLRGVVHAAGVLDDALVADLDPARLGRVLAPKLAGGATLHRLSVGLKLDLFVLFGSAAAVLGSPGQSAYAAGNGYLAGLAAERRAQGLVGLCVSWGPWAGGGMAAALGSAHQARLAARGLRALAPAAALAALERALGSGLAHVAVLDLDWPTYAANAGTTPSPLISELLPPAPAPAPTPALTAPASGGLRATLAAAPAGRRRELLATRVAEQVAMVLGLPAGEMPEPRQGLFDLGVDSMIAMELRRRLERDFDTTLPATLAFDYPTIDALVRFLHDEVLSLAPSVAPELAPPAPPTAPDRPTDLDALSDEEMEALLLRKLATL
jgi:acyl transferase domain-containing protein/acyl carrier protein